MPYEVTSKRHPDRNAEDEIAVPGSLWYKRPFKIHRNIGVDNDRVVCLTSVGKPCPICEKRSELVRQDADKEDTDALKQSLRNLYVVVPLDSKKHEVEPHIMDMSQYLCQDEINNTLAFLSHSSPRGHMHAPIASAKGYSRGNTPASKNILLISF